MELSFSELSLCKTGKVAQVLEVRGGCNIQRKLADMGVLPGVFVEILKNEGGPVLLGIGQSRLVLGRGMANKVIVGRT